MAQFAVLFEEFGLVRLAYADSCVNNFNSQFFEVHVVGHINGDGPSLSELDCVLDQVNQNLSEADFISLQEQLIVILYQMILAFIVLFERVKVFQLDLVEDDFDVTKFCLLLEHILDQIDGLLWLEDVHVL